MPGNCTVGRYDPLLRISRGRIYQPLIYCGGLLTLVIGAHVYQLAQGGSLMPRSCVTGCCNTGAIELCNLHIALPPSPLARKHDKGHFSKQYPLTVFLLYFVLTVGLSFLIFRLVEEAVPKMAAGIFLPCRIDGAYGTSGP